MIGFCWVVLGSVGGRSEFSGGRSEFSGGRSEFSGDRSEFSGDRSEFSGGRSEFCWAVLLPARRGKCAALYVAHRP